VNPPSLSRRGFLASSGAWLGGTLVGLGAKQRPSATISLIHTTDLHGHILPTTSYSGKPDVGGFARCATQIRTWRKAHPDSLLLDIGDLYQGTPESYHNHGSLMIRLLNQTGYDAWVPGNHDFDWGADVAAKRFAESKPTVVSANLTENGTTGKSVSPWTIKDVGGFKIAIIGLTTPGLPAWLAPETLGPFAATDPTPALRKAVREARAAGAQAIVVLSHMGWKKSDDYANPLRAMLKEVPDVDVLLAGHTHQDQPSWTIGQTLCSQASYHGLHCGRVELEFDPGQGRLIRTSAETAFMDNSIALDPAVLETCKNDLDHARQELSRVIATATRPILDKGRPNELATLFCETFANALHKAAQPVDGVIHGTFGTGGIEPGDVTVGDCWRLLPYENLLMTARMPAIDLLAIERELRKSRGPRRLLWPFEIHFDQQGTVTHFTHNKKEVDPDTTFTLACNAYDGQSGGRSLPILHEIVSRPGAKRSLTSISTRTALIDALADRKSIP
jgi:2',3'-cyclic-nucleotide 2'-phosphodiesterase/3'-nucleotidase